MVFDIEAHERDRKQFLATLYEIAAELREKRLGGVTDPTAGGGYTFVVAERMGIERPTALRIMIELHEEGLIEVLGGGNDTGRYLTLTRQGASVAEQRLYDNSSLGKRRKAIAWAKGKAKELAASGAGKIAGWVCVYLAGVASGVSWRELARWFGRLLGP